jgi:hypothetical protein
VFCVAVLDGVAVPVPVAVEVADDDWVGVDDGLVDPVGVGEVVVGVGDGEVPDVVGVGDTDGDCPGLLVGDAVGHAVAEEDANGGRTVGIAVGPRLPDPGAVEVGVELPPGDTY